MSKPLVLVEREGGVAVVTLNRPEAMNALSVALRVSLVENLTALEDDTEIGVVILTGAGRAFCAGVDLKELGDNAQRYFAQSAELPRSPYEILSTFAKPVIGAINGFAITGGYELALSCDILIASTDAKFADTHGRVGVKPGGGASARPTPVIGISRTKEMALTGNYMTAREAEAFGLVNRVVAPEQLLPTCKSLAADMLSVEPAFLAAYKKLINDGFDLSLGEALALETRTARKANAKLTAADIEARRAAVRARGQTQSS